MGKSTKFISKTTCSHLSTAIKNMAILGFLVVFIMLIQCVVVCKGLLFSLEQLTLHVNKNISSLVATWQMQV